MDQKNPRAKWNRETISDAIRLCGTRSEFKKRYNQAYKQLKKHKWNDLLDILPPRSPHPPIQTLYWTPERIMGCINECSSRYEFRLKYPTAYNTMSKHGWHHLLDKLPMLSVNPHMTIWCVYCWRFIDTNAVYIGLTSNYEKRITDELRYSSASPVHDYIESTGSTYHVHKLHDHLGVTDAADSERAYIEKYRNDGYTLLNRNLGGSIGAYGQIFHLDISNEDLLAIIFDNYNTYKELRTKGGRFLLEAKRRGIQDDIFQRLPKQNVPRAKYEYSELEKIVASEPDMSQFKINHPLEWVYIKSKRMVRKLFPPKPKVVEPEPVYSYEEISAVAKEYNDGSIRISEAGKRFGISYAKFRTICSNMGIELTNGVKKNVHHWTKETLLAEILKTCTSMKEFHANNRLRKAAYYYGIYANVASILPRAPRNKITYEMAKEASQHCNNLADFMHKYPSMYGCCRYHGWHDILDALAPTYRKSDMISDDDIRKAISQCTTRTEFNRRFSSESNAAKKRGIYAELVKDMPKYLGNYHIK